jgi:hypothetical protein
MISPGDMSKLPLCPNSLSGSVMGSFVIKSCCAALSRPVSSPSALLISILSSLAVVALCISASQPLEWRIRNRGSCLCEIRTSAW